MPAGSFPWGLPLGQSWQSSGSWNSLNNTALPVQVQQQSVGNKTLQHPPSLQRSHALTEAVLLLQWTENHKGECSAMQSWGCLLARAAGWEVVLPPLPSCALGARPGTFLTVTCAWGEQVPLPQEMDSQDS